MNKNEPQWADIDVVGELTGKRYFGRFSMKRYLTHRERADAVRLAETLCRGIQSDTSFRTLLSTIAFLSVHIVEIDAKWWVESGDDVKGLELEDEAPIWALAKQINEIQKPDKPATPAEEPKA